MDHDPVIAELKKAVEFAKGLDVELSFSDESNVAAGQPVSNLRVTFASGGGNQFVCLSSIQESLRTLPAEAITVDFFGCQKEVIIGGKAGSRPFNIVISFA